MAIWGYFLLFPVTDTVAMTILVLMPQHWVSHLLLIQVTEEKRKESNRIDRTEKNCFPNSGPLHKLLPLLGSTCPVLLFIFILSLNDLSLGAPSARQPKQDTLCSRDTCFHPRHFLMTLHSTKLHMGRGNAAVYLQGWPNAVPVVKGSDYTCLTDRNCWLYWLCSREDERIHHTITSAKIIKNKTDNLLTMRTSNAGGLWANRPLRPCWQRPKQVPSSWWGTWPHTLPGNSTLRTMAHKNNHRHTTRFFTTYFITGKTASNPKIKLLLLKN